MYVKFFNFEIFFLIFKNFYLFVFGFSSFHYWVWAFFSCQAWASHWDGFSCCRARALVYMDFSSGGSWAQYCSSQALEQLRNCGTWVQVPCEDPWDPQTRDPTPISCIGKQILFHWATGETPQIFFNFISSFTIYAICTVNYVNLSWLSFYKVFFNVFVKWTYPCKPSPRSRYRPLLAPQKSSLRSRKSALSPHSRGNHFATTIEKICLFWVLYLSHNINPDFFA